jgi:hypothetical protein
MTKFTDYKISIHMIPDISLYPKTPYCWTILAYYKDFWCNEGHGWSTTSDQAWKDANEYFKATVELETENV